MKQQRGFAAVFLLVIIAVVAGWLSYFALPFSTSSTVAGGANAPQSNAPAGENLYCSAGDIPAFGTNDGPATLPQSCYDTDSSVTPSPGATIVVSAGQSVSAKLSKVVCGDVVTLAAGATFSPFMLPAKGCNASNYITIRTSSPNSSLPPEGTRISPCYAGVASLPNRPAYPCTNPTNVMAQVNVSAVNGAGIFFAAGADYYRFIGIEVTRSGGTGTIKNLINTNGANHVIFDRMWLHGTDTDSTLYGITLDTSNYVAVIDSYLNNFHCPSTVTSCVDNKAITGGSSATTPEGTWKIVNDFLEGAAENVGFGIPNTGLALAPTDIEIRHNYFYKPTSWMLGDPNYNGLAFAVRDHIVFKNGSRALIEGNILQNSWAGFGTAYGQEVGPAIILTPRTAGGVASCPGCWVTDITVRYNYASHLPQAIAFTSPNNVTEKYGSGNNNFSVHDDVFDDLNYNGCSGCSTVFTNAIYGGTNAVVPPPDDVLQNLTINHITEVSSGTPIGMLKLGGTTAAYPPQESNIVITNSIFYAGTNGFGTPGGGTANCEDIFPGQPEAIFNNCWSSYSFAANVVVGGSLLKFKNLTWPATTYLPTVPTTIQFVNLNGGVAGNYQLEPTSPYAGAGTDGLDIGANISSVNSYTSGSLAGAW